MDFGRSTAKAPQGLRPEPGTKLSAHEQAMAQAIALATKPGRRMTSMKDREARDLGRIYGNQAAPFKDGARTAMLDFFRSSGGRSGPSLAPSVETKNPKAEIRRGSQDSENLGLIQGLGSRSERSMDLGRGSIASGLEDVLGEISTAEAVGVLTPEEAGVLRVQARERLSAEVPDLKTYVVGVDVAGKDLEGRLYRDSKDSEEGSVPLPLAAAGAMALGRAQAQDLLLEAHVRRVVAGPGQDRLIVARERLEADLHRVTLVQDSDLDLNVVLERVQTARASAMVRTEALTKGLHPNLLEGPPSELCMAVEALPAGDVDRLALEAALHAYEAARNPAEQIRAEVEAWRQKALVEGMAQKQPETGQITFVQPEDEIEAEGRLRIAQWLDSGTVDLDDLPGGLEVILSKRYEDLGVLSPSGLMDQETIEAVQKNILCAEASEIELLLAAERRDESAVRLLLSAERVAEKLREQGSSQGLGVDLEGIPEPEMLHALAVDLLQARAQGGEERFLEDRRDAQEKAFGKESQEYLQRNLPLLEKPDWLPDLELLQIHADAVSGNIGLGEGMRRLSEVECRDFHDRYLKAAAWCSLWRNSVGIRAVGCTWDLAKAGTEHAAITAWAIANALAKITFTHLVELGVAVGTGGNTMVGAHLGLELLSITGESFGKGWMALTLIKGVRQQRKQLVMQRRQEVRERLQNRHQEIDSIVKNHREGAIARASYLDGIGTLQGQLKKYFESSPGERRQRLEQLVQGLQSLDARHKLMEKDHPGHYEELGASPEVSIPALRRKLAQSLGAAGCVKEGAIFDEVVAQRAAEHVWHVGKAHVHLAADASTELRALTDRPTDPERPDPFGDQVRNLVHKGYGTHGDLVRGMLVVDGPQGPMGMLLRPSETPGVALIPLELDEHGDFIAFKPEVRLFDLEELGAGGDEPMNLTQHNLDYRFLGWAKTHGLNVETGRALETWMRASIEKKGLPFVANRKGAPALWRGLRQAGVVGVPGVLDDDLGMPFSSNLKGYWEQYGGRGNDSTEKLYQAAVETGANTMAWDSAIGMQSAVAAVRSRLRQQRKSAAQENR